MSSTVFDTWALNEHFRKGQKIKKRGFYSVLSINCMAPNILTRTFIHTLNSRFKRLQSLNIFPWAVKHYFSSRNKRIKAKNQISYFVVVLIPVLTIISVSGAEGLNIALQDILNIYLRGKKSCFHSIPLLLPHPTL